MFWYKILMPKQPFEGEIKSSFHVSMAAISLSSNNRNLFPFAEVFFTRKEEKILLCTLNKEHTYQCALNLNFEAGETVGFSISGLFLVCLTGYYIGKPEIQFEPSNLGIDPDSDNKENKGGEVEKKGEKEQVKTAQSGGQGKDQEKGQKVKKDSKKEEFQTGMSSGEGTSSGTKGRMMITIKKK